MDIPSMELSCSTMLSSGERLCHAVVINAHLRPWDVPKPLIPRSVPLLYGGMGHPPKTLYFHEVIIAGYTYFFDIART